MRPVLASDAWPTNGHLLADVAKLYVQPADVVLDPTYGRGLWWSRFRPCTLIAHDLALDGVDFTALPEPAGAIDVVAFDPPYVAMGGRMTSGLPDMTARYGMIDAPRTPHELRLLIEAGMAEAFRVLRRQGRLLVKCQDYISSGCFQAATHWTHHDAEQIGFRVVDRFEHVTHVRPQPPGRRQVHARRNLSTLLVFVR